MPLGVLFVGNFYKCFSGILATAFFHTCLPKQPRQAFSDPHTENHERGRITQTDVPITFDPAPRDGDWYLLY